MKVLESVISFLQFKMNTPTLYGWFHLLSLVFTVIITIILVKKAKNDQKVLLIISLIMIAFEVYKQLSFSFNDGVWSYDWDAFPFQFCSTPMYIAFLASIIKNAKVKKYLYSFLVTYGLLGGVLVMLYPSTVFISETLINIQTMVHHGSMVVMGLYLLSTDKVNVSKETFIKALSVFIVLILIALGTDIVTYYLNIGEGLELFYISPYHQTILPVFELIYPKVPYILFLLLYLILFTLGSLIPIGVYKLFKRK